MMTPRKPKPVAPERPEALLRQEEKLYQLLVKEAEPAEVLLDGGAIERDWRTGDPKGGSRVVAFVDPDGTVTVRRQRYAPGSVGPSSDGFGSRTYGAGWTDDGPAPEVDLGDGRAIAEAQKKMAEAEAERAAAQEKYASVVAELDVWRASLRNYESALGAWYARRSPEERLATQPTPEPAPELAPEPAPVDEKAEFLSCLPRWGRELLAEGEDPREVLGREFARARRMGEAERLSSLLAEWGVLGLTDAAEQAAAVRYLMGLVGR